MKSMKVRAKKIGFYDGVLRKEGDVFDLTEVVVKKGKSKDLEASKEATKAQFSDNWMEVVERKVDVKPSYSAPRSFIEPEVEVLL